MDKMNDNTDISPASINSFVYLSYTCNNNHPLRFTSNIYEEPLIDDISNLICDGCKRLDYEDNDNNENNECNEDNENYEDHEGNK